MVRYFGINDTRSQETGQGWKKVPETQADESIAKSLGSFTHHQLPSEAVRDKPVESFLRRSEDKITKFPSQLDVDKLPSAPSPGMPAQRKLSLDGPDYMNREGGRRGPDSASEWRQVTRRTSLLFSHNRVPSHDIQNPAGLKAANSVHEEGYHDNQIPKQKQLLTNFVQTQTTKKDRVLFPPGGQKPVAVQSPADALQRLRAQNITAHNELFRQMIEKNEQTNIMRQQNTLNRNVPPLPEQADSGVDESGTRKDTCSHCFHSNFSVLLDHPAYCQDFTPNTVVLLLISSAPNNVYKRQAIRGTWGQKCQDVDSDFRCLFVLGKSAIAKHNEQLREENDQHGDILQFGFMDAYSNLTYKTLSSLYWVNKRCSVVNYVMKTDDDMFVNTELLPKVLSKAPSSQFMGGYCWSKSHPNRDVRSKWFVSLRSFQHALFPPMCSGTGYVMSTDVVRKVLVASEDTPFFHLEDVYVALCLQKIGIQPVRLPGFNNMFVRFEPCRYRHGVITSHEVPSHILEKYWTMIQSCAPLKNTHGLYIPLPLARP